MTIVGLGIDLAEIRRLEEAVGRRGERLLRRLFTDAERRFCEAHREPFSRYAARLAAKEATIKALATDWSSGLRWIDIEVLRKPGAAPELKLHGAAHDIAAAKGVARLHLALTHDAGVASAVVVAESDARRHG